MKNILIICFVVLFCFSSSIRAQIPTPIAVQIVRAEDERRFDRTLEDLMKTPDASIRTRAALAAGRIGDERAVPLLVNLLENDTSDETRVMAAFALGEIESLQAADAIIKVLANTKINNSIRARSVEAAGKIAAANAKDEKSKQLGEAILQTLQYEDEKRSGPYENVIALGLTAVLRARPAEAENTLVRFIEAYTPQIRANALNALARIRAKNANEQSRDLLQTDADPIVRANAARVLGAAEDADSFDVLLKAATSDKDSRVRVSAIRSLGSLKNAKAADKLLERGATLLADYKKSKFPTPSEKSELLEIATTFGRILPNSDNEKIVIFLNELYKSDKYSSSEVAIGITQISPVVFANSAQGIGDLVLTDWRVLQGFVQALGLTSNLVEAELSKKIKDESIMNLESLLGEGLGQSNTNRFTNAKMVYAIPGLLRAYTSFKTINANNFLRDYVNHKDLIVRTTAAELLGDQSATKENLEALKTAFVQALEKDKDSNDAQLAILSALVKLDKTQAASSLKLALAAPDYLVRRHAANLIRQNDLPKDFPNSEAQVGTVKFYNPKTKTKLGQIFYTNADYRRAVSRKNARAILTTEKGAFTIEFFPEDAPLTVDNFIRLARANYFNGLAIHRVVPNFVMQDGDPRGDGNGGPGWQIRCELNMREYERGAVGMALSGKDTGGSQWFVTHSPQPHLDGGYTVFGRVNETDMKVVDTLVRGDKILSVKIVEGNTAPKKRK